MFTSSKDCTYVTDCESLFCKTKQKTNIRGLLFLLGVLHKPRGAWFHFSHFKVLHSELSLSCLVTSFCFALFPFWSWALFPFPLDPPHTSPLGEDAPSSPALVLPCMARAELSPLLVWLPPQYIDLEWTGLESFSKHWFLLTWLILCFLSDLVSKTSTFTSKS